MTFHGIGARYARRDGVAVGAEQDLFLRSEGAWGRSPHSK